MSFIHFTPASGLIGGSLIGLAAGTLLLFNGDILGASGIISSIVIAPRKTLTDTSQHWKLAFIAAFCLTSRVVVDPDALRDIVGPIVSPMGFIVGGFCVGFGTKLGNGCTSGHGICGLARFSKRSLMAVLTFMSTGIISTIMFPDAFATAEKHLVTQNTFCCGLAVTLLSVVLALPGLLGYVPPMSEAKEIMDKEITTSKNWKTVPAIASGALFSLGLYTSGMTNSNKIVGFLNVKGIMDGSWDPTLACVMGGGLLVSFLSYQWVKGFNVVKNDNALECPLTQKSGKFNVPTNKIIDAKLIIGAAMFGIGWSVAGICPGPGIFLACAGYPNVIFKWWPSFFLGSMVAHQLSLFIGN